MIVEPAKTSGYIEPTSNGSLIGGSMADVIQFPNEKTQHHHERGNCTDHGRASLRELVDALQILALTRPAAVDAIVRYARFIINAN
jgi:hypothetical protein